MKEWIYGRRAVAEHLKLLPATCEKLLVAEGATVDADILAGAERAGVPTEKVPRKKIEALAQGANHQGLALLTSGLEYAEEDEVFDAALSAARPKLVLALDCVQDPGNLGAILRVADGVGAAGVVIPKDRAAGLTAAVARSAAGAAASVKVAQVVNLARSLDKFKDAGFWIVGASHEAEKTIFEVEVRTPVVLVLGAEGEGIRPNVAKRLDVTAKLPMLGAVSSLNVSVAAGVFAYELLRRSGGVA